MGLDISYKCNSHSASSYLDIFMLEYII